MYCEGARSKDGSLSQRPKPGIGKLALQTGAPVVPVAIHGSAKVRNWRRGQFPKVTVQYGDPIRWERVEDPTRDQQMAVAEEIFGEIKVLHSGLETLGRKGVLQRLREQRRLERRGKKRAATA
jgi:1-acyl-sn-glycerol-3-phosphate acyltransferase